IAAAAHETERARARQVVGYEPRFVQIHARRRKLEDLAAVRADVRALAADPLVARRWRHLILKAEKGPQRSLHRSRGQRRRIAAGDDLPERIAVVRLRA